MFDLLYHLRWNSSSPLHLNEFSIPIIGRQWRSQVDWFAHAPLAIKAGLAPEVVADLKAQRRPLNMKADETLVCDFVTEIGAPPRAARCTTPGHSPAHVVDKHKTRHRCGLLLPDCRL